VVPWSVALSFVVLATTWAAQPIAGGEVTRRAELVRLECTTDDLVEAEVTSTEPFPVRNALTELHIGEVTSMLSRYSADGDTHTLIFSLTRDQFQAISADETAFVGYNPSNGQDSWLIGPIDPATALGCAEHELAQAAARGGVSARRRSIG